MQNIPKTLSALAAATALILTPIHSAHASSLSSLSSSSAVPSSPVPEELVDPPAPVDDRPARVRLVEAAEEGLTAAGFVVDPQLTVVAQRYAADPYVRGDEMSEWMGEAGYTDGWGVSTSYGYPFHWESMIREFQEGRHFIMNYHYSNVGVAVSEPDWSDRSHFVIVNAGEEVRFFDEEGNLLPESLAYPSAE